MDDMPLSPTSDTLDYVEIHDLVKTNKALKHTIINITRLITDAINDEETVAMFSSIEDEHVRLTKERMTSSSSFYRSDNQIERRRQQYRG